MRHPLFAKTKYFILDMDGTFYLGDRMIPGAGDFVRSLAGKGLDYRFFTNNSSHSEDACRARLERMGFPVEPGRVVLSNDVAADYLNAHWPGARVYLLGNENLTADMLRAGINLVQEDPELIMLGFDTTLDFAKMTKAANWIAAGLPYYATHPDINCPVADGFLPDTGAMIALFEASAKRRPVILGKPERTTVDYLTRRLQCTPEELVFVGDRLETDIAIAARHGFPSVLVLTGVATRESYAAQSDVQAGLVVESLKDIADYL